MRKTCRAVAIKGIEELAPDVYLIAGEDFCSNSYLLVDGPEALLIDAGSGSTVPALDLEFPETSIRTVLLTHGHADHVHGMRCISADGLLHERDLAALAELNSFVPGFKAPDNLYALEAGEKGKLDASRIPFGKFSFTVIEAPGHTPGSVAFFEQKTKLLFSGDTLFAHGSVGRTDLTGGDKCLLEESVKKLENVKRSLLCPGHGAVE